MMRFEPARGRGRLSSEIVLAIGGEENRVRNFVVDFTARAANRRSAHGRNAAGNGDGTQTTLY